MADRPSTPRAKARAATLEEIKAAARRQVGEVGAAGLSVRLIARELGRSSSAIYRYFESRDELLTALILDGYAAQGAAVEAAEALVDRGDVSGRFMAVATTIRRLALDDPNGYALLYGSPVPGYEAPPETVAQAARPSLLLAQLLVDAAALGKLKATGSGLDGTQLLEPELLAGPLEGLPPEALAQGVLVWTAIYGLISFELFGHLKGSVADAGGFFEQSVRQLAGTLGIS